MPRRILKTVLVLSGMGLIGMGYYYMSFMPEHLEYGKIIQLAMRSMGLIIGGSVMSVVALLFVR